MKTPLVYRRSGPHSSKRLRLYVNLLWLFLMDFLPLPNPAPHIKVKVWEAHVLPRPLPLLPLQLALRGADEGSGL